MNEKINIQDIVELFAQRHGVDKKNAEVFVKEFFLLIEEGLEKDKYVKVKGLGTFKLIEVDSRESVDVNTGERIEIKGHTKVSFTPEPALKEVINRPFAHFESVVLKDSVVFDDLSAEDDANKTPENDMEADLEEVVLEASDENKTDVSEELLKKEVADVSSKEDNISVPLESVEKTESVAEEIMQKSTSSSGMKVFLYFLVIIILGCLAGLLAMYWEDINEQPEVTQPTITIEESLNPNDKNSFSDSTEVSGTQLYFSDTVAISAKDTTSVSAVVKVEKEEHKVKPTQKVEKKLVNNKPFTPDSTGYDIVGTEASHTIKEGETLTRIALKFYGTKALWPYIVKHNAHVITNPDNVPLGTTIKIPKLKKKQ